MADPDWKWPRERPDPEKTPWKDQGHELVKRDVHFRLTHTIFLILCMSKTKNIGVSQVHDQAPEKRLTKVMNLWNVTYIFV